jgi:hypothetical protein
MKLAALLVTIHVGGSGIVLQYLMPAELLFDYT